jgi:hypothetical protein
VLVICPTSLKYQWQSEIMRFSGRQGENAARVINGCQVAERFLTLLTTSSAPLV